MSQEPDQTIITVMDECVRLELTLLTEALAKGPSPRFGYGMTPQPQGEGSYLIPKASPVTTGGAVVGKVERQLNVPTRARHCFESRYGFTSPLCVETPSIVRDCRTECNREGACTPSPDHKTCTVGPSDCASSTACTNEGKYTNISGRCQATTDTGKAAQVCLHGERCRAKGGVCVTKTKRCVRTKACKERGRCTRNEFGQCLVSRESCRASLGCSKEGHCSVSGHLTAWRKECKLIDTSDCQNTAGCAASGTCVYQNGRCVVGATGDCYRSSGCKKLVNCHASQARVHNKAVMVCAPRPERSHCRNSEVCKKRGRCSAELGSDMRWECVKK